jgi:ammonia channel protein AmtB
VRSGKWDIIRLNQFVENYRSHNYMSDTMLSHSPQSVALGTFILWFGWVMFNATSSGGVDGESGERLELIICNTIIAPCVCGIVTFFIKPKISPSN